MQLLNYSSFGEFLSDAGKYSAEKDTTFGMEWYGNATYSQALELARHGWPEGTQQIRELSWNIANKITSHIEVPTIAFDVEGIDFDMGMHLSGAPESWYHFQTHEVEAKGQSNILKVVYNYGARGTVSPEAMKARGFTCAALIRALEFAGKRVELVAINHVTEGNGRSSMEKELHISIPVKAADQELDIDRLSFILAHPAMLRRLGFGVRAYKGKIGFGHGFSQDADEKEQGDIYFNAGIGDEWTNPETAQAWIMEQLKKQGVQLSQ